MTDADRRAEALLAPALAALLPGSVVVGEEAAASDPAVLDHLSAPGNVWLLDPLDGTANFAAGRHPFALMTALLHRGETVASWMLDPLSGRLAAADRGAGAWLDGGCAQTALGGRVGDAGGPPAPVPAARRAGSPRLGGTTVR